MNNNVRIARQLVRIAKMLAAFEGDKDRLQKSFSGWREELKRNAKMLGWFVSGSPNQIKDDEGDVIGEWFDVEKDFVQTPERWRYMERFFNRLNLKYDDNYNLRYFFRRKGQSTDIMLDKSGNSESFDPEDKNFIMGYRLVPKDAPRNVPVKIGMRIAHIYRNLRPGMRLPWI